MFVNAKAEGLEVPHILHDRVVGLEVGGTRSKQVGVPAVVRTLSRNLVLPDVLSDRKVRVNLKLKSRCLYPRARRPSGDDGL